MPQGHSDAQRALPLQRKKRAQCTHFQDLLESRLSELLRLEQAYAALLNAEFFDLSSRQPRNQRHFVRRLDAHAELRRLQGPKLFGERVHAQKESVLAESIPQFAQIEGPAVHRSATPLRRIEPCAEPFEVGAVPPVHDDIEPCGRRVVQRVLRLALDRLGQFRGSGLAQRQVHPCQMFPVERVELRVVGCAVFRTIPPTPVAAFRG